MYFAESKARTTVGSVSEETVVRADADQFIELECSATRKVSRWKWRRARVVDKNPASLTVRDLLCQTKLLLINASELTDQLLQQNSKASDYAISTLIIEFPYAITILDSQQYIDTLG